MGTITDNDVSSLSIDDVTVIEGQTGATAAAFTISLTPASIVPVSVNFATANGTALAPGDYSTVSGTLTFTPGQTSRTIFVPITNDSSAEAPETFFVNLIGPRQCHHRGRAGPGHDLRRRRVENSDRRSER